MLVISPASLSFTSGTAATQNLSLTSSDSNPVSVMSIVFPPGFTAQHPYDVEVAGPLKITSPLGDGIGFSAFEIMPGQTLTIPVVYSGTGTANYSIQFVYNGYGGTTTVYVPVAVN